MYLTDSSTLCLQIQNSVELLTKAKTPLLVLGSQALLPPVGADELRKAVEKIGIPCFLGVLDCQ